MMVHVLTYRPTPTPDLFFQTVYADNIVEHVADLIVKYNNGVQSIVVLEFIDQCHFGDGRRFALGPGELAIQVPGHPGEEISLRERVRARLNLIKETK